MKLINRRQTKMRQELASNEKIECCCSGGSGVVCCLARSSGDPFFFLQTPNSRQLMRVIASDAGKKQGMPLSIEYMNPAFPGHDGWCPYCLLNYSCISEKYCRRNFII